MHRKPAFTAGIHRKTYKPVRPRYVSINGEAIIFPRMQMRIQINAQNPANTSSTEQSSLERAADVIKHECVEAALALRLQRERAEKRRPQERRT